LSKDEFVPETAINYDVVFERGGRNHGDEDFALFKCPLCNRIYLFEYEVDTVYLDGTDLSKRAEPPIGGSFTCVQCAREVPRGAWAGERAEARFRVRWSELRSSDWAWVTGVEP
jgi:hypothetical protein